MSLEYLQQTFKDFSSPNGTCRILHATAGASTCGICKIWPRQPIGEDSQISDSDPDRPYAVIVKKTSSKLDGTGYASLRFAQSKTCLPQWCCDCHNNDFNLLSFFHGEVYIGTTEISTAGTTKRKRAQLRATAEQQQLLDTLVAW
ncbi:hypothetical protein V8E55_002638 [Tylopilus felleus]